MNWRALEQIRGLSAVSAIWHGHLADDFESFKRAFLVPSAMLASHFPCANCGCAHQISNECPSANHESHPTFPAICTCDPWNCPDLLLTEADARVWELNWARFGRELCGVFELSPRFSELHIHNTVQIGSWSADAVPAIFTVQTNSRDLRNSICELAARLRKRFILLAPTSCLLDATCHEILANADAGFFALENLVSFDGALRLMGKSPGELFARFSAQPKEVEEDVARRAFALLQKLDSERTLKSPSPITVFRLYCLEEMTPAEIAEHCNCSRATVINRLKFIEDRTGTAPAKMRRLSPHLSKLEDELRDSRAANIHRQSLFDSEDGVDD